MRAARRARHAPLAGYSGAEIGIYHERPWPALCDDGKPAAIEPEHRTALDMFASAVRRAGDRPAIRDFGSTLTWADVDRLSDGLAVGLRELGVAAGDRVAVCLQNVPQHDLATVATWRAGAIVVPANPMNGHREVEEPLDDCGTRALVTLESLCADVAAEVVPRTGVEAVITTSELDFLDGTPPAMLAGVERRGHDGTHDLIQLARSHAGHEPEPVRPDSSDVAFLVDTSGLPRRAGRSAVPVWTRASRHGRISKAGASETRHMLGEVARKVMLTPGPLRAFFERVRARRGPQVAATATARKLVVLFWHMLAREQDHAFGRPAMTRNKIRELELLAGAPPQKSRKGIAGGKSKAVVDAERELSRQAEAAYRQLVNDWRSAGPPKVGAGATPGRASQRPSKGKAARQATSP